MRNLHYAIMSLCLLSVVFASCHEDNEHNKKKEEVAEVVSPILVDTIKAEEPQEYHISLLFAGDLMQHTAQINAALQPDGSYDYNECFERMHDEIERANVAIANFETTLSGHPYKGYPCFRAPDAFLQAVKDAGFDILLTANNHCLDGGKAGLERTIRIMDSLQVSHLGTYVTSEERDSTYPFLLERNGFRIVLLNFTYGTNGIRVKEPNIVNGIDTTQISQDLKKALQLSPDVIIALPHWGLEHMTSPSTKQKQLAKWLFDHGVDHIIGGHPHAPQPIELSPDKHHLIAWSLGNYIDHMIRYSANTGYMIRMEFTKRNDSTQLTDWRCLPYWVSHPSDNNYSHNFRVMPLNEPDSLLTKDEIWKRNATQKLLKEVMEKKVIFIQ